MKSINLFGGNDKSSEALFGDNKTKDMTSVEDIFSDCKSLT